VSITTSWLMLFGQIICVACENHLRLQNTVCFTGTMQSLLVSQQVVCIITTIICMVKIVAVSICRFKKLCLLAVRTAAIRMKRANVAK
jgi:hypothetical protein